MIHDQAEQAFTVATDERLIELIESARSRLVVVAPALTTPVSEALAGRCPDDTLEMTVVLDADAEVYRLGYGDQAALEFLRAAMTQSGLGLARQTGIRIGLIIADEQMLIYSPVPRLIEGGSSVTEKPNAIMVGGSVATRVAAAAGGGQEQGEIGKHGLGPSDIAVIQSNLAADPPQKFDIARAVRVFSSQAEFVELEIENLRVTTRRVPLPPEFMGVRSADLKPRISGTLSVPTEVSGPFEITVEQSDGEMKTSSVSSKWVNDERAKIERDFTFLVPRHGRVILLREKEAFKAAIDRFERNVERYRAAASAAFSAHRDKFKSSLVDEFLPAWAESPPHYVTRFSPNPSRDEIKDRLSERLDKLLDQSCTFEPIRCRLIYKGITWTSANDPDFVRALTDAMRKRDVPEAELAKLFREFDAAKAKPNSLPSPNV